MNKDFDVFSSMDDWDEPDSMDMPCLCDCGTWFDLNDGYPDKNSNKVICPKCHRRQVDDED